jgi:hypothetical protein
MLHAFGARGAMARALRRRLSERDGRSDSSPHVPGARSARFAFLHPANPQSSRSPTPGSGLGTTDALLLWGKDVAMAHAHTNDDWLMQDPDLRDSLRIIRRQHTWRLIGVVVALLAALATAIAYASLSYSDRNEAPAGHRR